MWAWGQCCMAYHSRRSRHLDRQLTRPLCSFCSPCVPFHAQRCLCAVPLAAGWHPPTIATQSSCSAWHAAWGRGAAAWSSSFTSTCPSSTPVRAGCGGGAGWQQHRIMAASRTGPQPCSLPHRLPPAPPTSTQSTACSAASCPTAATTATAATRVRRTPRTCATTRVGLRRWAGPRPLAGWLAGWLVPPTPSCCTCAANGVTATLAASAFRLRRCRPPGAGGHGLPQHRCVEDTDVRA